MYRDADRLMVSYLHLEFAAMFVDESYFASEAPLCCMDADGRNHARLAADDVRRNFRTITLDLQRLRIRVTLLVVDAHIPAAEVVEISLAQWNHSRSVSPALPTNGQPSRYSSAPARSPRTYRWEGTGPSARMIGPQSSAIFMAPS